MSNKQTAEGVRCGLLATAGQHLVALPWIRERAEVLQSACSRVELARQRGVPVRKACREVARGITGRPFRSEPEKHRQMSASTLTRVFYGWIGCGKKPEAFRVRYVSSRPPVSPEIVRGFVQACGSPWVTSIAQAMRLMVNPERVSAARLQAVLPSYVRKAIRQAFRARRQAQVEAKAQSRKLQRDSFKRHLADQVRTRKLQQLAQEVGQ